MTCRTYRINSLRCANNNVEEGVYFGASSNLHSNYLKVNIAPRKLKWTTRYQYLWGFFLTTLQDYILNVHGKKDYLALELLENEFLANVENRNGAFRASYSLGNKLAIDTGTSLYVVSVGVDGHFSKPGLGAYSSTDTRSALYVGGHERALHKVRGVRSRRGSTT